MYIQSSKKDVTQRSSALLQEIPQTSSESADPSLLAIVQSQRERFRLRVQELENENSQQSQNMQESYLIELEREFYTLSNVDLYYNFLKGSVNGN